jgi:hypothetical protein
VKHVIEGHGEKVPALGGAFTYCTLSEDPLKSYYGTLRAGTPWLELAGYVWQAETSKAFDPAGADPESGRVGQDGAQSVYLLYAPESAESRPFNPAALKRMAADPARGILVYAEKLWVDPDVLRVWQRDNGKVVRARLLPVQLR